MTLPPQPGDIASDVQQEKSNNDAKQQGRFSSLEFQLDQIPSVTERITKKHWSKAEKEQYPFWVGIIVLAILGILGRYLRGYHAVAVSIAVIMILGLVLLVVFYLRSLQGRFKRQWSELSGDGELFRFLRDAGVMFGYPIQMGQPDERFSTKLEVPLSTAINFTQEYLRDCLVSEQPENGAGYGLFILPNMLEQPPGSETHRIFDVEYRGSIVRAFSIRLNSVDNATEVIVGFTIRHTGAETREVLKTALSGRLQDRMLASKIIADIREASGAEPVDIPMMESSQTLGNPAPSRAV